MRTRRDLSRRAYLEGMRDACRGVDRLHSLAAFLGHDPDGRCHWPKCVVMLGAGRRVDDADAFFCAQHCPICSGDWGLPHDAAPGRHRPPMPPAAPMLSVDVETRRRLRTFPPFWPSRAVVPTVAPRLRWWERDDPQCPPTEWP